MELKRKWKRIIAAFLSFVMALCFVPSIPALADGTTRNPETEEWKSYRGTDCTPANPTYWAERYYGDTGVNHTEGTCDDDDCDELYFIIGGTRSKKTNKIQSQTQKHPHLIQKCDGLCDAVNVIFEPERILDGI